MPGGWLGFAIRRMPKGKSHLGHAQMGYFSKKITFKKGLSVFLTFPFGVRDDLAVRGFRSEALGSEAKCDPGAPAVGESGSQQAGWRMQPKASHVRELSQPGGGCQHRRCHDEQQGPAAALTPEGAKALLPKTLTLTSGSETG